LGLRYESERAVNIKIDLIGNLYHCLKLNKLYL